MADTRQLVGSNSKQSMLNPDLGSENFNVDTLVSDLLHNLSLWYVPLVGYSFYIPDIGPAADTAWWPDWLPLVNVKQFPYTPLETCEK